MRCRTVSLAGHRSQPSNRAKRQRVISSAWMFPSLALPAAFFLSGAAGLIFQVVWLYRCGLVLGSSVAAVTVVLSGFMAGLALGNALAARFAARVRPSRS